MPQTQPRSFPIDGWQLQKSGDLDGLDLVRQHLLTAEVASEQLGMTVSEFEELLKEHHK